MSNRELSSVSFYSRLLSIHLLACLFPLGVGHVEITCATLDCLSSHIWLCRPVRSKSRFFKQAMFMDTFIPLTIFAISLQI